MNPLRGACGLVAMLLAATALPAMAATRAEQAAVFDAVAGGTAAAARAADDRVTPGDKPARGQADDAQDAADAAVKESAPAPASPVSEQPPYVLLLAGLGVVVWLGHRSTASQ